MQVKQLVELVSIALWFLLFTQYSFAQQNVNNQAFLRAEELFEKLDYKKAITYYKRAEVISEIRGDWGKVVDCKNRMALCFAKSNLKDDAIAQLDLSQNIIKEKLNNDSIFYSTYLLYKGQVLFLVDNHIEAEVYLEKALGLFESFDKIDNEILAETFKALGNVKALLRKELEADSLFKKSIDLLNKTDNYLKLAATYNDYNASLAMAGKRQEAIKTLRQAINLVEEKVDKYHPLLTNFYLNIGSSYSFVGDYAQSNYSFQRCYSLCLRLFDTNNIQMINLYILWGNNHYREDKFKLAIEKYKAGINIIVENKNLNNPKLLAQLYNNISLCYFQEKETDEATKYLLGAIELKKEEHGENSFRLASSYANMSIFLREKREFEKSENYLNRCIDIRKHHGGSKHKELSYNYWQLGELYKVQNKSNEALSSYQKSIIANVINFNDEDIEAIPSLEGYIYDDINLINALRGKAQVFKTLYEASENIRHLKLADLHNKLANEVFDMLHTKLGFENSQLHFFEIAKPQYEFSILVSLELYELTNNLDYLNAAFEIVEKSKAKILLSAINKTKKQIQFPTLQTDEISRLQREYANIQKDIYDESKKNTPDENKLKMYRNELFGKKDSLDQAIESLKLQFPSYFDLTMSTSVIRPQIIQNNTAAETVMLEYFITDSTLITFAIDQSNFLYHRQKIDSTFHDHFEKLMTIVRTEPSLAINWEIDFQQFKKSADFLYHVLIGSVFQDNLPKNLVIIPDGKLGHLPFEILIANGSNTPLKGLQGFQSLPYLFEEHNIRYEYSATIMLQKSINSNELIYTYVGFAPVYSEEQLYTMSQASNNREYGGLKHNVEEVEHSASLIAGTYHIRNKATKVAFMEVAPNSKILHLAMHGDVDDENPLYSKLIFTNENPSENIDDNYLYAYELYNITLNADLAVLSACNTGMGKIQKGEGVMSLSRAFKYAGCPNIVMSLWNANDLSSKNIMVNFFNQLKDGKGKDIALNEARKQFLHSVDGVNLNEKYAHPYYWANFVLIGNNEPINLGFKYNLSWLKIGAILLLFLVVWSLKRSRII